MATLSPPDTQQKLKAIWERNRPQVMERLALLDRAAEAQPLTEQLREEAVGIAHKLAGSLGMFGFAEGTRLARMMEHHFEAPTPNSSALSTLSSELRESLFPADA